MQSPATRHSIVEALRCGDADRRRDGYGAMVAVYWKPLYKYLRLKWHLSVDAAQDATQAFFARAYEKNFFEGYDPAKARFRTFLRVCADRFVANERKSSERLKRGGAESTVSLDFETAEGELRSHDVAVLPDFDEYFHAEWVRSLCAMAIDDLRAEYDAAGKTAAFNVFERYDVNGPADDLKLSYADVARDCGVRPTDVTNYLFAARRAFRRCLLDRLRSVCGDSGEFEAEARQLLRGDIR
jgi:DNA-directed RNA polymerase specialized sigma24 family protein